MITNIKLYVTITIFIMLLGVIFYQSSQNVLLTKENDDLIINIGRLMQTKALLEVQKATLLKDIEKQNTEIEKLKNEAKFKSKIAEKNITNHRAETYHLKNKMNELLNQQQPKIENVEEIDKLIKNYYNAKQDKK